MELTEALAVVLYLRIKAAGEPSFEITSDLHRIYAKALRAVSATAEGAIEGQLPLPLSRSA